MTDITGDEFDNALYELKLTRGQAREKLGMSHDTRFTNYRDALARLGHPKYQTVNDPGQSLAQAAEQYAKTGVSVFPLVPGDKRPAINGGKGFQDATTELSQIKAWWRQWPDANIGSPIPAGYVVFDVDVKSGGMLETLGDIPRTAVARSGGGGGWHVWFKLPDGMEKPPKSKYDALPGIEVWSLGHFMVLPPSVAKSPYKCQSPVGRSHLLPAIMPNYYRQ